MGIPVDEWIKTHTIAHGEVGEALRAGLTVVVDDTSSPKFLRDRWRSLASDMKAEFALLYAQASTEVIERRLRANRTENIRHDVLDDVMREHLAAFEPPELDEAALQVTSGTDSPQDILKRVLEATWSD